MSGKRGVVAHNRLPDGQAAFNELYGSYRSRARKRGIPFELTRVQFEALTKLGCHYCGQPPSAVWKLRAERAASGAYLYNGVDRISSEGGYVEDNVITCCGPCNYMKSDRPIVEFVEHVRRISRRLLEGGDA